VRAYMRACVRAPAPDVNSSFDTRNHDPCKWYSAARFVWRSVYRYAWSCWLLYNVLSIDPHLCIRGNVAQGISMQDMSTACKEIYVLSIFTNGDIVLENTQVHVCAICSTHLLRHCLLTQRCMSCLYGDISTLEVMT